MRRPAHWNTRGKRLVIAQPRIPACQIAGLCPCSTMFRIDEPHLAWCLESLVRGEVVNQIVVDPETAEWARVALERMLSIT